MANTCPDGIYTETGTLTNAQLDELATLDTTQLALLDDITASAAELNLMDGVTATTAEINIACDQSAGVQAISAAGAITATGAVHTVNLSGTAYAFTLAVPGAGALGKFLRIEMTGGGTDAKTLALTNVTGGTAATTASFNADGEGLLLFGGATKWVVVKEYGGVTLS